MNVAEHIIEKCGGAANVAAITGVHISRVHRWTYPKERGGTGGLIPAGHQQTIMNAAVRMGLDLAPSDFFDMAACTTARSRDPQHTQNSQTHEAAA